MEVRRGGVGGNGGTGVHSLEAVGLPAESAAPRAFHVGSARPRGGQQRTFLCKTSETSGCKKILPVVAFILVHVILLTLSVNPAKSRWTEYISIEIQTPVHLSFQVTTQTITF